MANIRIDNASDDVLKIELDGEEYFIPEDESITVSSVEKGMHKLIVCRTKRTEIGTDVHSDEENPTQKFSRDEKSQYVRLKGSYEIDVIGVSDWIQNIDFYGFGVRCSYGEHFGKSDYAWRQKFYLPVDIRAYGD